MLLIRESGTKPKSEQKRGGKGKARDWDVESDVDEDQEGGDRRIDQIVRWCGGKDFHGIIALDEVHRAKNMTFTDKTSGKVTVNTKKGQVMCIPRAACPAQKMHGAFSAP